MFMFSFHIATNGLFSQTEELKSKGVGGAEHVLKRQLNKIIALCHAEES